MDLAIAVPASLKKHPAVKNIELTGSRRKGTATQWSDWDFSVETIDFDLVSASLPGLTRSLVPISYLWDPLSDYWVFMMILKGPTKVDLIFDRAHPHESPWTINSDTLQEINSHFWDWILWIASKDFRGLKETVREELNKMYFFLLVPLGIKKSPSSIEEAVQVYKIAFERHKHSFQKEIVHALDSEVLKGLRMMEYKV